MEYHMLQNNINLYEIPNLNVPYNQVTAQYTSNLIVLQI